MTPKHIAIIMDGNRRWANKHHLPKLAGHQAGMETAKRIAKLARQKGIKVLSLFTFGTENWQRPQTEINHLMSLLSQSLAEQITTLNQENIRLRFIGNLKGLTPKLQQQIEQAQLLTEQNQAQTIVLAINYGGQWDIAQAAYALAQDLVAGNVTIEKNTIEQQFASYLCLSDLPSVDLFIRTSGELRISNFLLWQIAYAELYFTNKLWPDFDEQELNQALLAFKQRQRRFGK